MSAAKPNMAFGGSELLGFAALTPTYALRLGLTGHAKNLPDGSVEVMACGDAASIDQLEKWLWQGPPAARVDEVQREDAGQRSFDGFFVS